MAGDNAEVVCVAACCRRSIIMTAWEVRLLCMECHSWFACQKLFGCVYPVCVCVWETMLLAVAVAAVVKLVVFFQAKGKISGAYVCVGVPSSPHVSSADPLQELHADQCVCVPVCVFECVVLQKGPACSDVPAALLPSPRSKELFQSLRGSREWSVSLTANTHTHSLWSWLFSKQVAWKKKKTSWIEMASPSSLSWQREREGCGWGHLTLSLEDPPFSFGSRHKCFHVFKTTHTHTGTHKTLEEKQLFQSQWEVCEKCLWWDGCGWDPFSSECKTGPTGLISFDWWLSPVGRTSLTGFRKTAQNKTLIKISKSCHLYGGYCPW